MDQLQKFSEQVAMKFRLFSGLFYDLPFKNISQAGTALPMFSQFCNEELEKGTAPNVIVTRFLHEKLGIHDPAEARDKLFAFMQLVERQVVLFDAVEDATFHETRDMEGSGSLHDVLSRIEESGAAPALRKLLPSFGVRVVLTAHPTQFYTDQVLSILQELRTAIQSTDVQKIWNLLLQLGRTRFKKRERPTPFDEAKSVLWFMEHVLYEVLPEIQQRLSVAAGLEFPDAIALPPAVELGFWPGGDRDGNPNVDSSTTIRVGKLLHDSLVRLYLRDVAALGRRLTFDGAIEAIQDIYGKLASWVDTVSDPGESLAYGSHCVDPDGIAYSDSQTLLSDLVALRALVVERHGGLFVEELDRFIYRVKCFGFYFASMDLRQDSRIIAALSDHMLSVLLPAQLKAGAYLNKSPAERLAFVSSLPDSTFVGKAKIVLEDLRDPVLRDLVEVFRVAAEIQRVNGERGVHRFIISNTQSVANVIEARAISLLSSPTPASAFDFVPLFETIEDLEHAKAVMKELWSVGAYRSHLESRKGIQHIMLGFSDGTKDGGYMTANWGIYRAKQSLSALARDAGYRVVFFDGRGGPPARGGGNTHKFYRSLGHDIESRTIHVTIQGQTISSMYGHTNSARYNLEQLVSAVLDNNLRLSGDPAQWDLAAQDALVIQEVSEQAYKRYLELKEHPKFMDYLQDMSPLKFYAQANISSRPSRRSSGGRMVLGDLRAIPFVGAWSQLKQNVPGYFGLGSAIKYFADAGRIDELSKLYRNSMYFRTLLENSMQSLSKVYLPLTAHLEDDTEYGGIRSLVAEEVERSVTGLLAVSGQTELLGQDPINRNSIRMREDMIVPMIVIQQFALLELREGKTAHGSGIEPAVLEKMIVKSMAASINASRNSV